MSRRLKSYFFENAFDALAFPIYIIFRLFGYDSRVRSYASLS